jgi:hypothetical protein
VGYLSKPVDVPRLIAYLDNASRIPDLVATDVVDTTEPLP